MMRRPVSLTGLLSTAGVLAGLATLAGFAGQLWWLFELTTHFRVQYALALGSLALILLALQQWPWAALLGAFALLNLAVIAQAFEPDDAASPVIEPNAPTVRALLANIHVENRDPEPLRRLIATTDPDLILLLETTPWLLDQLRDLDERYPQRLAKPRDDPFGMTLFSRLPLSGSQWVAFGDASGPPSLVTTLHVGGQAFTLIGTHPWPPVSAELAQGRNQQLQALTAQVRHSPPPVLVLGDLNLSPWSPWFTRLLSEAGLHDSRRGRGLQPSWPAGWPPLWIPIDHALFSTGIQIRQRVIGPDIGSDHYPVIVDFQVSSP